MKALLSVAMGGILLAAGILVACGDDSEAPPQTDGGLDAGTKEDASADSAAPDSNAPDSAIGRRPSTPRRRR